MHAMDFNTGLMKLVKFLKTVQICQILMKEGERKIYLTPGPVRPGCGLRGDYLAACGLSIIYGVVEGSTMSSYLVEGNTALLASVT